jgi:hypothetical protein
MRTFVYVVGMTLNLEVFASPSLSRAVLIDRVCNLRSHTNVQRGNESASENGGQFWVPRNAVKKPAYKDTKLVFEVMPALSCLHWGQKCAVSKCCLRNGSSGPK